MSTVENTELLTNNDCRQERGRPASRGNSIISITVLFLMMRHLSTVTSTHTHTAGDWQLLINCLPSSMQCHYDLNKKKILEDQMNVEPKRAVTMTGEPNVT